MKILRYSTIITIGIVMMTLPSFNDTFAQNVTNSSNVISPIPSAILHSPVPTLSPSEIQSVVKVALSISELQNWSHDWQYVTMGFGSNNKSASGDFEWQYASVVLKAPSSSAPFPCNNDWQATVVIDMTTMKVVSATYPTMESHSCQVITLGGSVSGGIKLSNNTTNMESPLKQFKSGTDPFFVICNQNLQLVIKSSNNSPACVRSSSIERLLKQGWVNAYDNNGKYLPILLSNMIKVQNTKFTINYDITGNNKLLDANMDAQTTSLVLSMSASNNGTLSLSIPRALLDSKDKSGADDIWSVIMDAKEIEYTEKKTDDSRNLSFSFDGNTKKIVIIPYCSSFPC